MNAQGRVDIDIIIIATNTTFSNPTRDWVKSVVCNHPRPVIRLWDRTDLECLLSKHPAAVLRVFSKALSPQGRLEVIRRRLWNFSAFTDVRTLREIWRYKDMLQWDYQSRFAILVSEFANGNPSIRPWVTALNDDDLANDFANSLANVFYLADRADSAGVEQLPHIRAISHLLLTCLDRFSVARVNNLIDLALTSENSTKYPNSVRADFLDPIITQAMHELRDVCTDDCSRVYGDKCELSDEEVAQYWLRFRYDKNSEDREMSPHRVLTIEKHTAPCKVGFNVSEHLRCPFTRFDDEEQHSYTDLIDVLRRVVKFRKARAFRTKDDGII